MQPDLPPDLATRADELLRSRIPNADLLAGMTTDAFKASGLDQRYVGARLARRPRGARRADRVVCLVRPGPAAGEQPSWVVGGDSLSTTIRLVGSAVVPRLA